MAVWIVLGHLGMSMNADNAVFMAMQKLDLAVVGLFFLLSGYGTEKSYEKKPGYLRTFPLKIFRLFMMTLVQFGISELCFYLLKFYREYNGIAGVAAEYLKNLNWFMWELALLYILFCAACSCFKKRAAEALTVMCILMIVCIYLINGADASCYSALAFPAGVLLRMHEERIDKFMTRQGARGWLCLLFPVIAFIPVAVLPKSSVFSVAGKNIFCVLFCAASVFALTEIKVKNKFTDLLAAMSAEIYLYQYPAASVAVILFLRKKKELDLRFASAAFVLTILMAFIVYLCRSAVERVIRKWRTKR